MTGSRIPKLFLFLLATEFAAAQVDSLAHPYLVRLEHINSESHLCVLLQKNGAFHLETNYSDRTQVSEGIVPESRLRQVEHALEDHTLAALSQGQIEEPLSRSREDVLQINVFRGDHRQDLIFRSEESRARYSQSLQVLAHWLDQVHKLPHRELSEEEGKNNCLPASRIALERRSHNGKAESSDSTLGPAIVSLSKGMKPAISSLAAAPSPRPAVPSLLRLNSSSMKAGSARQACVLIIADGAYRAEERAQKAGSKRVETKITGGRFAPQEILQLQQLLVDPGLAQIRHRETSQMVLPMSGEMLNLQISRPSGVQELVLSSTFGRRDVPFFYSGDGNISSAQSLLKFIAEHIWTNGSGGLDPGLRNDCQDAP